MSNKGVGPGVILLVLAGLWFLSRREAAEAAPAGVTYEEMIAQGWTPEELAKHYPDLKPVGAGPAEEEEEPAPVAGFSLRIVNAPAGAAKWNANFAEKSFGYDPMADSGWLSMDEAWEYPSDPLGVTTLRIWMVDAENNIVLDARNGGPVLDGVSYVFDASTQTLQG